MKQNLISKKNLMNDFSVFTKSQTRENKGVFPSIYGENRFNVFWQVTCPCKKSNLYLTIEADKDGNIKDTIESVRTMLVNKLFQHIENKVRIRADKFHIDLLITIIGKEEAIKILDAWSKRNMLVAMALQNYIKELKKEVSGR